MRVTDRLRTALRGFVEAWRASRPGTRSAEPRRDEPEPVHPDASGTPPATARDVPLPRSLEADLLRLQRWQTMGAMAGRIAHDFNNQLYVILGRAGLAQCRESLPDDVRRDLVELEAAAQKASAITQQMLTFSRSSAGSREGLDLVRVTEDAFVLLRAVVPKTIAIEVRVPKGEPHPVLGHPTELLQIIVNLVRNAVHAMRDREAGTITIEVDRVVRTDAEPLPGAGSARVPGRSVRLRVRDEGTGMSPETRRRALEPYCTSSAGEGRGLGLVAVGQIVREMGGAVEITSTPGEGSTVEVSFPEKEDSVAPRG